MESKEYVGVWVRMDFNLALTKEDAEFLLNDDEGLCVDKKELILSALNEQEPFKDFQVEVAGTDTNYFGSF